MARAAWGRGGAVAVGGRVRYGRGMRRSTHPSRPLPSRPAAGVVIGGMLAAVEHLVVNRPRPVAEIEERHHEPWSSIDGLTVEGLDRPVERPPVPDRSRARL